MFFFLYIDNSSLAFVHKPKNLSKSYTLIFEYFVYILINKISTHVYTFDGLFRHLCMNHVCDMHICAFYCVSAIVCACLWVRELFVYASVCVCACVPVRCMCAYMCVYICVCVCVYVCVFFVCVYVCGIYITFFPACLKSVQMKIH